MNVGDFVKYKGKTYTVKKVGDKRVTLDYDGVNKSVFKSSVSKVSKGLGDVVENAISKVDKALGGAIKDNLPEDCGCNKRKNMLNRMFPNKNVSNKQRLVLTSEEYEQLKWIDSEDKWFENNSQVTPLWKAYVDTYKERKHKQTCVS